MCGRYTISVPPDQLAAHFDAALPSAELRARLNAAPSQDLPVLLNDGERVIQMLHWGLIPRWADDPAIGNRMINARAETVAEKPAYKDAFMKRRCLVLADGFYEWQKAENGKGKVPIRFSLQSGEPFAFAGLWETWKRQGEVIRSFTIITTAANDLVAPVHDRMPVVLRRDQESLWLDNDAEPARWLEALASFPADLMRSEPASPALLRDFSA